MNRLNIDEYILKNYKEKTNAQMALECGCNKSTISNHRKKLGISWSELNSQLKNKTKYICSQKGKKTRKELSKELNCSISYIEKIWKENNLTGQDNQIYYCNEKYFNKIDTEEKAYWLGFIAADGNLYRRDGHKGLISISVNKKDIEILNSFQKQLNTTKPISFVKDKRRENTEMATIQINSDLLFNQLINIGIGIKKTFDLSINSIINSIPNKFINSFILGYFDGDGSIDIPKNKTISKSHVRICGPIKNLIDFQNILKEFHINSNIIEDKRKYKEPFGSLEMSNTTEKYSFLKFIYSSNIDCLKRKKELSDELIKRIENNSTNRSENIDAVKNFNLWF